MVYTIKTQEKLHNCPLCEEDLFTTRKGYKTHVSIRPDNPIRSGFVYTRENTNFFGIVINPGILESGKYTGKQFIHTHDQPVIIYDLLKQEFQLPTFKNSAELRDLLGKGKLRKVSLEELSQVKGEIDEYLDERTNTINPNYSHLMEVANILNSAYPFFE